MACRPGGMGWRWRSGLIPRPQSYVELQLQSAPRAQAQPTNSSGLSVRRTLSCLNVFTTCIVPQGVPYACGISHIRTVFVYVCGIAPNNSIETRRQTHARPGRRASASLGPAGAGRAGGAPLTLDRTVQRNDQTKQAKLHSLQATTRHSRCSCTVVRTALTRL